jgi:predicted acylesterase/phospholipase RssA
MLLLAIVKPFWQAMTFMDGGLYTCIPVETFFGSFQSTIAFTLHDITPW